MSRGGGGGGDRDGGGDLNAFYWPTHHLDPITWNLHAFPHIIWKYSFYVQQMEGKLMTSSYQTTQGLYALNKYFVNVIFFLFNRYVS